MIKEFLGKYLVSSTGEIYSKKTGQLIFQADNNSRNVAFYKRVKLYNESGIRRHYYVHRIVAALFIGDITGMSVDHIDGNQANNDVSNLRIVTQSENMRFMHAHRWSNDGVKIKYTKNSKIVSYVN